MPQDFKSNFNVKILLAEFDVLRMVVMKNSMLCEITPRSLLKVNRHFGGTCRLQE
jgi:hypothetical protein